MSLKFKKVLKYILISFISILLLVFIIIEVVFNFVLTSEKITPKIVFAVNENLNADFKADRIELSFFSSFPNFTLEIENGSIVKSLNDSIQDQIYIKHDTLIGFKKGRVTVNPTAFLMHKKIDIRHVIFEKPQIYAYVDQKGNNNWDIVKETSDKDIKPKESDTYQANIDLDDVRIENGQLYYDDRNTELFVSLENLDLKLKARYNKNEILLDLKIDSDDVNFWQKGEVLINDLSVGINGDIKVNRKNHVIDVANTKVRIEDIEFIANGELIPEKEKKELDVQLDLALKVPSLNSIIRLIPEDILEKKNDFRSKGKVFLNGKINGIYGNGKIPVIQADLQIKKGQLAYNDMPKKIDLIETDMSLFIDPSKNSQSYINLSKLHIKGDKINLQMGGSIEDIFGNAKVMAQADGFVDLESFSQTFPLREGVILKGELDTDLQATFYLKDIKNEDYNRTTAQGKLSLVDVLYTYKTDSIIFESKNSKAEFLKDNENQKFNINRSKVLGGKIDLSGIKLTIKNKINVFADSFFIEYASAGIKDTTQIALIRSTLKIKNAQFNLQDTLKGMILKADAKIVHQPSIHNKEVASIHADFFIDSIGLMVNKRFFAITQGNYNFDLDEKSKKRWPVTGEINFNKLYAFTPSFPLLVKMPQTKITVKPGNIELDHANILLGRSDLTVTGKIVDFDKTLFEDKNLIMKMDVKSNRIDANELIATLNKGAQLKEVDIETLIVKSDNNEIKENTEPKTFVIPKKIDFEFNSRISNVLYKNYTIENTHGLITVKDQTLDLKNLQMNINRSNMMTKVRLTTKVDTAPSLAFDFKLNKIDLKKLIDLLPVLDTLLPMSKSFEGNVNFRIRGTTKLTQNISMMATSLAAIARIEGKNMTVLNGEAFESISKKLMFKNKEENIIDEISVEILIDDNVIEILPAQVFIDRYRIAVGGLYKLDMTYDYQFSILKSPLPFKAGVDMIGDKEDYKLKLTRAKYKHIFSKKKRHLKKVDSTLIKKKMEIVRQLPF